MGVVPASPKVMDGRRRGAIRPTPSRCDLECRLDQQPPTGSRRHACHPAVPIQENKVPNIQPRDKSTTRNSLCLARLTFEATLSTDVVGIAPPASPRLLWRPAAAVASTASHLFVGRRRHPMRRFRSSPPFGGRLRWRLPRLQASGVAGNGGRQENPFSFDNTVGGQGREEDKLVYSMLSFRLHIQVKSTWWLPKQWAWQDLKTTGKTKGRRFLINSYTHARLGSRRLAATLHLHQIVACKITLRV
jgi:hypothetical protein